MDTQKKKLAAQILRALKKYYPDVECTLENENPFQMLVATILSAQCTDKRVNQVTEFLFKKYQTPEDFLAVPLEEIEMDIKSTGFYHNKAKNIKALCERLVQDFEGQVPADMETLVSLPGVGRKTANVVMGNAFGIASGFVVDTHVSRLSQRLGLSNEKIPEKIEKDLVQLFPAREWINLSHRLIALGREFCTARKTLCDVCCLNGICPNPNK